jgi:ubiquinone/menaquinone biosynthesis C-methylase UbiE
VDRPAWFLDEIAHAGVEHLDPAYVATYNDKAQFDPSEDLALLRALGLTERSMLVDLGAGSGTFALAAATLCRRVVAVDISPAMLATLRAEAAARNLDNVECVQAGFLTYVHQGDPADVVYSRHALHHVPDFWKAVALVRMASILRPGGVLRLRDLVYACEPRDIECVIEPWLAAGAARPEEGWTRQELETHVREEYSPFNWALEAMLAHAGFQIKHAEYDPSRIYAAYTCVKG